MTADIKYGKRTIPVSIPKAFELFEIKEPEFGIDKKQFLDKLLAVLPNDKEKYTNVGVVLSDKTRLCGYPLYLPWLIEALRNKGTHKENIIFYIAYGTHAFQTDQESLDSYGETFSNYKFVHHNCNDEEAMKDLGHTKRGTPVKIRADILNSSLLITFGSISHHYFAGFGGGRKLLFPGLAAKASIYSNHGLFLDKENGDLHPGCQPGNLEKNPIAEDLKEIDDLLPAKISIHGILNSSGKVCKLMIGTNYKDFLNAGSEHNKYFKSGIKKQYDMVIASSGGYPKDINFIQAHKSLHHAAAFVRDGGKLVLFSECIDGIGSETFMKYLEPGSFSEAFKALKDNYEGNGGTALSLMKKTGRIEVYLCTSLDEQTCKILRIHKLIEEDVNSVIESHSGSVAVIENASLLIK